MDDLTGKCVVCKEDFSIRSSGLKHEVGLSSTLWTWNGAVLL